MEKRTIIKNEYQLNKLLTQEGNKAEPNFAELLFGDEDGNIIFCLHPDFGKKLDMSKESALFVNRILNRLLEAYNIDNYKIIGFEGKKESLIQFLSNMIGQYIRYTMLRYYRDENEDFLS